MYFRHEVTIAFREEMGGTEAPGNNVKNIGQILQNKVFIIVTLFRGFFRKKCWISLSIARHFSSK